MFRVNALKKRLAAGEQLCGAWVETGSATNAEILGHLGFDFLIVDLEHGQGDLADAIAMMRAAEGAGTPVIVRVPWNDPVFLKRILDVGAQSLMIPSVENAAEARAAVAACRYPPAGTRGYGAPLVRASTYGTVADYIHVADQNLLLLIQIESAAAVAAAAEICAVDGVDVPFLGVNDLAGSIGRLEQLDHPDVRRLVAEAEAAIRAAGKPLATVPSAGASAADLFAQGYALVPVASDVTLLRDAALACLADQGRIREGEGTGAPRPAAARGY